MSVHGFLQLLETKILYEIAKPINILSVDAVLIFESTFKIKWKPILDMVCE